jgi:hypothetical protein
VGLTWTNSTGSGHASSNRQLPACIRGLLDRLKEAVQVHRGVEHRQAALPGPDRRGEQGIRLADLFYCISGLVYTI